MKTRPLIPILAAGLLAPAAAHAATAPTPLSVETAPALATTYHDLAAWSSLDNATGRYRLILRDGTGAVRQLPVPESTTPFDVDLGTSRRANAYAVYTRCQHPGTVRTASTGCDIYRLAIASGKEERLARLSSPRLDERQPTIYRGKIAFVRTETDSRGVRWSVLRIGGTTGTDSAPKVVTRVRLKQAAIVDPQLSADRIAYTVVDPGPYGFSRRSIHLRTLNGKSDTVIYRAVSGGANAAGTTRPAFGEDQSIYFARTNLGSGRGNRIVRYSPSTHRLSYATGSADIAAVAPLADGAFVISRIFSGGGCLGNVTDPITASHCSVSIVPSLAFDAKP